MTSPSLTEMIPTPDQASWRALVQSDRMRLRGAAQNALLRFPLPMRIAGFCGCCGKVHPIEITTRHATLTENGGLALGFSETAMCPQCQINSRMRFACELARAHGAFDGGRVYMTERKTHLYETLAAAGAQITGSEFLGADKTPGAAYDGVVHQDIHRLTYPDASFAAVMSLDVLEHVEAPLKALAELRRVLAPGGIAIVTFPFYADRDKTVRRSRLKPSGAVEHLLPPLYHGNPLGGGSLVFHEFAWDFIAEARRAFGEDLAFSNYWSFYGVHFGPFRFVMTLRNG